MKRQYVKGQFQKMMEGDLVSDAEKRAMEKQSQQQVAQSIGAQQRGMERAAMAQTGGSPLVAGAMQGAARQLGAAGADAAVTATGQDKRLQAALRDKRAGEAMAAMDRFQSMRQREAAQAIDYGFRATEVGAQIIGLMGDSSGGGEGG